MINHGRTLILNDAAGNRPALGTLGEEYVPTEFTPLLYSTELQDVRRVLIGSIGDPLYQNYRLAQLMAIAHGNQYARQYILELDSRYTYQPFEDTFIDLLTGIVVTPLDPGYMTLIAGGTPTADDSMGRAMYQWQVQTAAGPMLSIRDSAGNRWADTPITITGEDSSQLTMENGVTLQLHVPTGAWKVDASWIVSSTARPTKDLSYVLAAAGAIVRSVATVMTDVPVSFKNLWTKGVSEVDRLGGLIGAFVYKAEQVRMHV